MNKAVLVVVSVILVMLISTLFIFGFHSWEQAREELSLPTAPVQDTQAHEQIRARDFLNPPDPTPEPLRVQTALFKAVGRETWVALSGEDLDRVSQVFLQDPNWEVEINPIPAEAQVACRVGDDSHLVALAYLGDSSLADLYCQSFKLFLETP